MKLSTLRENIGSEVKLSKSANTFIEGCRFYIETVNNPYIRLKVVGPTATTCSYRSSRSIVSLIIPVKKAPSIKTMKGKSFSNEFKVLCSLRFSSASIGSGYTVNNKKEISTLTEAGLLKEIHGLIIPTATGKALVKKRLASIIKSGKTFSLRDNIVKVVRQHNTAIELEILKTGETLRSTFEEFPQSAITVKYTKPVVTIKEGDIVRIKKCTDKKSIIGKTAKAIYILDGNSMKIVVDGYAWWASATDIEFVKTPAIKKPKVVKPKEPKVGDIILLDIETHNPYGWVDELKANPELPWQIVSYYGYKTVGVRRGTEQWNIGKDNIKKVLTKTEAKILIGGEKIKSELIAERKKATAKAKRVKAYQSQVAKVLELQKQLNKEIDKRRKLYYNTKQCSSVNFCK